MAKVNDSTTPLKLMQHSYLQPSSTSTEPTSLKTARLGVSLKNNILQQRSLNPISTAAAKPKQHHGFPKCCLIELHGPVL
jgi:hypothetical protein